MAAEEKLKRYLAGCRCLQVTGILRDIAKTIVLVGLFFTFSISLTFYNKWTLSTENLRFPLSITCIHLIVKFMMSWVIRKIWTYITKVPRVLLDWKTYFKRVFVTGITSSLDIGLSNWSLLFISVTLYTMSKSTATVFVLLFAIILKLEKPRMVTIAVVALIVGGLFLFTYKSTSFDWEGFILVISASFLTGVRWTSAQILLQKEELGLSNPLDTIYHLQPIMILTLVPLATLVDGGAMATSAKVFRASELGVLLKSSAIVLFAALLAFCLEFSEFLFVSSTSGLALSIAGVVKEVVTLSIATTLFDDDTLSAVNIAGMVVCLMGVTLHVVLKVKRMRDAEKASSTEQVEPLVARWRKNSTVVDSDESEEEVIYSFDKS